MKTYFASGLTLLLLSSIVSLAGCSTETTSDDVESAGGAATADDSCDRKTATEDTGVCPAYGTGDVCAGVYAGGRADCVSRYVYCYRRDKKASVCRVEGCDIVWEHGC